MMDMPKVILLWLVSFSLAFSAPVIADDGDVRFSGFGTVGVAWSSQRDADIVNTAQPYGPGRTRALDMGLDSMLAVQADAKLGPRLDGVVQVFSGRHADGSFRPEISLANVRYEWSEDVGIRAGRLPPNRALAAEYRRVNFTLPWSRPPAEVYGLFSASPSNGAEILVRTHHDFGSLHWRTGSTVSYSQSPYSNAPTVAVSRAQGVFLSVDLIRGPWRWGGSLSKARSITRNRSAMDPLFREIRRTDPGVAVDFDDDMVFTYVGLGGIYDGDQWLVMGEWLRRTAKHAWAADQEGAYLTVGRRFGPTMPYASVARRITADDSSIYANSPAYALISSSYDFQRQNQSTLTLGVNHELRSNAKLKIQVDFIRLDRNSRGLYLNHGPDFNVARPPLERLYSIGVDFVF